MPLVEDADYNRAFGQIDKMNESVGMKHLLINWVTDLRLEDKNIPDKLLSRKKSVSFLDSVRQTTQTDMTNFRLSGMIMMITGSLFCMFIKAWMTENYLVNFSIDALIGVAAGAIFILNLGSQTRTVGYYGKTLDFFLMDGAIFVLWFLLMMMIEAFDFSLLLFLIVYFLQKKRFEKMQKEFLSNNQIVLH
ncbi:hypothetical protein [Allobaculum stercoricanis]|uniref:hypothetical protein n=1 Tax=Allobaculum stercoricanis TaxID=174709 RepID=UPI0029438288|nr:hypothetical protein [Allobaculum stercoricanis]